MVLLPRVQVVPKVWGTESWFINEQEYCFKLLTLHQGFQCSLHYHKIKTETFVVVSGSVELEWTDIMGKHEISMSGGDMHKITPGTPHRFRSYTGAKIFEISTHHDDADSYRLEESKRIDDYRTDSRINIPADKSPT
jgi:mannose-6-phosphate isomerase-like protein (cupin superfamily)